MTSQTQTDDMHCCGNDDPYHDIRIRYMRRKNDIHIWMLLDTLAIILFGIIVLADHSNDDNDEENNNNNAGMICLCIITLYAKS